MNINTINRRPAMYNQFQQYKANCALVDSVIGQPDPVYPVRQWYICPHCVKRVAKLYIGSKDVGCRECWKLHYKSQSGDKLDRMRMSIRRQRYAIWGDGEQFYNLFNHPNTFSKPKGMRWDTFERKLARLIMYEAAYWRAYSPVVDKITERVR